MVAWPTVFVALAIVSAFATVTTLGAMHIIPLWLGLILNTFILYFAAARGLPRQHRRQGLKDALAQ